MQHTSSEKLSEALELLEEAAKQKKEELRSVMSDKYKHLKNAIVAMRFDSSEIGNTMSEIVAYGTAVVVVPDVDAGRPSNE